MSRVRHDIEEALSHAAGARARLLAGWRTARPEAVLDALVELQCIEAHLADAFGVLTGQMETGS
jgi:hypothetical protein